APSTSAASYISESIDCSPASSSSAMNGAVFHMSANTIAITLVQRPQSMQLSSANRPITLANRSNVKVGVKIHFHASAVTTVIVAHGISTATRTIPVALPMPLFITSAMPRPSTNSSETLIAAKANVVTTAVHQVSDDRMRT